MSGTADLEMIAQLTRQRDAEDRYRRGTTAIDDRRSQKQTRGRTDDTSKVASQITAARVKNNTPGFQKNARVAEIITNALGKRGNFFNDGLTAYLFLRDTRVLLPIDRDALGLELLLHSYGLFPGEKLTEQVIDGLRLHAHRQAKIDVHAFAYYDQRTTTCYVYDFAGGVYRLTPDRADHVDNGTDGILFVQNPRWESIELAHIGNSSDWKTWLVEGLQFGTAAVTHDDQKHMLVVWILTLFFPQLFPTRVILALLGEKASGKSSLLRRIGKLIFGSKFNVSLLTSKPDDFDAAITTEPFVVADNADDAPGWFPDKLAVVATGGTVKRRLLYTTNRLADYPIVANLAVTSRTPNFKREDVAERLLPLTVTRLNLFVAESALLTDLAARRCELMSAILGDVQLALRELRASEGKRHDTNFRMADFADFALKIASVVGTEHDVKAMLDRVTHQQVALASEDQPLLELLDRWIQQDESEHVNVGRWIPLPTLRDELEKLAPALPLPWTRGNQNSFGQHYRSMKGTLKTSYGMTEKNIHGGAISVSFARGRAGDIGDVGRPQSLPLEESDLTWVDDLEDEDTQLTTGGNVRRS